VGGGGEREREREEERERKRRRRWARLLPNEVDVKGGREEGMKNVEGRKLEVAERKK
jgi:hypothetical protein